MNRRDNEGCPHDASTAPWCNAPDDEADEHAIVQPGGVAADPVKVALYGMFSQAQRLADLSYMATHPPDSAVLAEIGRTLEVVQAIFADLCRHVDDEGERVSLWMLSAAEFGDPNAYRDFVLELLPGGELLPREFAVPDVD